MAFPEVLQSMVKMDVLISGIGSFIPPQLDQQDLYTLNAWLMPHWQVLPFADLTKVKVYSREGVCLYAGALSELPESPTAIDFKVQLKLLDDRITEAIYLLSIDFTRALCEVILTSNSYEQIQRQTKAFFNYYK